MSSVAFSSVKKDGRSTRIFTAKQKEQARSSMLALHANKEVMDKVRSGSRERMNAMWATKEFRDKIDSVRDKAWAQHREMFLASAHAGLQKALKDPDFLKKKSKAASLQMAGQWKTPSFRKAVSAARKIQWQDPEFRAKLMAAASEARVRQGRAMPNGPEKELYLALDVAGVEFVTQHRIKVCKSFTVADAFIKDANMLIYTDGAYWHSLARVKTNDKRLRGAAKRLGYRVFVIDQGKDFGRQFLKLIAAIKRENSE